MKITIYVGYKTFSYDQILNIVDLDNIVKFKKPVKKYDWWVWRVWLTLYAQALGT